MNQEDIQLKKLQMLMNAINALDQGIEDDEPDFYGELKDAAFEYLLFNPGSEFGDWQNGLMEQYPSEIVDALGANPTEAMSGLADLWESDYLDPATGIEQKFSEWAVSFANEYATGIYYFLVDACADLKKMGRKFT